VCCDVLEVAVLSAYQQVFCEGVRVLSITVEPFALLIVILELRSDLILFLLRKNVYFFRPLLHPVMFKDLQRGQSLRLVLFQNALE